MTREIFEQRLATLSFRQESKMTALVEEYRKDLAEVHAAAVRYAQAGGTVGLRAHSVVGQLDETAVEAVAQAIAAQKPIPDTSLVFDLADGVTAAETVVTGYLKAALGDTRVVPQPPEMAAMEEVPPPHRVCDEAYVGLRRLLHPESYVQYLVETRHFVSLPDKEKNSEITLFLRTGAFTRFLDDVDHDEAP
jgi:hypothetical protein